MSAQHVIDQADHRPDDFGRRVIRAGLLAKRVVVNLQKIFIEVEPGVEFSFADRMPIHGVEHADQRAERRLESCLVADFVG